jgi:hypothetical protein
VSRPIAEVAASSSLLTALGFGRRRLGAAPGFKMMEQENLAFAPKPGEGQLSRPDPFLHKTVQPDAFEQMPPEYRIEQFRAGAAAIGSVTQQLVERLPEHEALLAEHSEESEDGETLVGHHSLEQQHQNHRFVEALLAGVLLCVSAVATLALLLAWLSLSDLGAAGRQLHELRARIEQLEQDTP